MKKNIYILVTLLLSVLSCQKEAGTPELEGGGIALSFICPGQTKTDMAGDDEYNENTLTTVDYFLYPEGETDQNAYIKGRVTLNGRTSYNVLVNTTQLAHLFAGSTVGSHCDVYAIANYPGPREDFDSASDTTSLRNLALINHFNEHEVQTEFVMSGAAKATIIDKNKTKAADATITLNRSAAKITFECHVAPSVTITNRITSGDEVIEQTTTWVPLLNQMSAYLVNGLSDGKVGGDPVTVDEGSLYRYSQRSLTDDDGDGWYSCAPFYSFAQTWNNGDEVEPFIKLVVPWAYLNTSGEQAGSKQFYYKVPCPGLSINSNTWYHIRLDVAILGGDDFEAVLVINGEYYVLPWNTQTIVEADAEIKEARYISAPANEYEMFNTNTLTVFITSSNESELNLKSVYYYDFVNKANIDYTSTALSNNWISYDDDLRSFSINHTLNNNISNNGFDSSPYIFTFEIRHQDDHNHTTGDIVITQYPAMYIDELSSNKMAFINGTSNQQDSDTDVYDSAGNSLTTLTSRSGINDDPNEVNVNSHMYRIHVTSVDGMSYTIGNPASTTYYYTIGDPRLWSGGSHVTTLTGLGDDYMEAAEINQDMIAPELMVASSVGKSQSMLYEQARTRCAAYQESGYPAGRWRLPTKAEIIFLCQLSEKGKIPTLFTPDESLNKGAYWCSSGVVYPISYTRNGVTTKYIDYKSFADATQYNNNKNWVRCIYDSWYWGEDPVNEYLTTWSGYLTTSATNQ